MIVQQIASKNTAQQMWLLKAAPQRTFPCLCACADGLIPVGGRAGGMWRRHSVRPVRGKRG